MTDGRFAPDTLRGKLGRGVWRRIDRMMERRDRLFASPRFQSVVRRIPVLRTIADRRARRVFDLCSGFVYSQTLFAGLQLGLFEILAAGPAEPRELAERCGLSEERMRLLLEASLHLELVERRHGGRFGLGALGAPLVGNDAIVAMVEHNIGLYRDLEDPVRLLRDDSSVETRVERYWPYVGNERPDELPPAAVAEYSTLMTRSHGLVADEVMRRYPFGAHRRMLDLGAGEGAFASRVARAHPSLEVTAFDLPAVADRARARLCGNGEAPTVRIRGGDFFREELPGGMDLVTLLRIVHDHDDDQVRALLRRVRRALAPGGRILIAEPMVEASGPERVVAAYFSWYLLAMGAGRPRSPEEIEALVVEAGFRRVRRLTSRVPVQTGLLHAER